MNSPSHDDLLEDIQATREQLGATVEELAHRLDVKAQVDEKVAETKEAVHAKVAETKEAVQAKVAETKETVVAKVADVRETVVAKAAEVKETVAAKAHPDKPAEPPKAELPNTPPALDARARATAAAGRCDVRTAAGVAGLAAALAAILLRKAR